MELLDRKLRNLEKIADVQGYLSDGRIDNLTLWIKELCHTAKSRDEVSPHLPPALRSGCWAAPFLGFV